MKFRGIPIAALDFYDDLEQDNSKTFWTANKAVYDESVKAPIEALATELGPEFGSGKFFRPYRDVRFAKDKTPYKTHQGVWFEDSRTYFHVSASGLWVAAGYWRTSPDQVARLRQAVADDASGPALERAVAAVTGKKFDIGGDRTVRVPAGYPKDHERADLLRHKTLTAHRELGAPDWLATPKAATEIAKLWRAMAPLVEWLDTWVGPPHE
ncbi:MAG: DUF2461 domain-containing protein [Sporichthyaceae bacterium]